MKAINFKISTLLLGMLACQVSFGQTVTNPSTTNPPMASSQSAPSATGKVSLDDATVTANVQTNLDQSPTLRGTSITVTTQQGIVTLGGTVDTQAQALAALDAAKSADGVKQIKSNIVVTNESNNPDY